MKNKWIFFALAPLFSFAAIQEEWLSETTIPSEIQEDQLKNKEKDEQQKAAPKKAE